ncbi:cupin domain-containing protein [Hymenobacter ruricola]|uniref:Cupin domain-containing protein n=1 Tax=Hymenobacter ruricola TaxID=2791023 RepID=A0ABS0I8B4_9BACT|nr:cupin domain-containing protein [Hymenobacter ruricola]MBF9223144.1 cupin domain-containing protein [Hymenobacter ruricola]
MTTPPLTVINLQQEAQGVESYRNSPLALVNDHVVRLSVMTEPFYWHYHPNSDEVFLVVEGTLCIDLDEETVEVAAGQLFAIPANTRHRTRPLGGRSVNLTFELAGIETIKC